MTQRGEDGYILASAVAVLLAISLVAAALVSASVDGLRRVQRLEAEAQADATLKSAMLAIASQLALDPRRRDVDLNDGDAIVTLEGRQVGTHIVGENTKLDVNLASSEAIQQALADAGADERVRVDIRTKIEAGRAQEQPISLVDDVLGPSANRECLHSVLTVFGGRADYVKADEPAKTQIGRPAAGTRLAIDVWLADRPASGLAEVVIMTGDPKAPVKVLDSRPFRAGGKERCHAG